VEGGGGWPRRDLLRYGALGLGLAAAAGLTGATSGCTGGTAEAAAQLSDDGAGAPRDLAASRPQELIGDGSTARTGPQPHQPRPERFDGLTRPPQFVVVSWDGAAELPSGLLTRFRRVAQDVGGAMTLFLSGIYMLPESRHTAYRPPRRAPGASDIPFLTEASVRRTIVGIGEAWLEGHEIGTHFNGHFCGPRGVAAFSEDDWRVEIDEAYRLVSSWRTLTGFTDLPALPFDYRAELVGARTPCLEGRARLLPVAARLGWRYDSSGTRRQTWPSKDAHGLWDLSMATIPLGHREVLAMDYNFMYQFCRGDINAGSAAQRLTWRTKATEALLAGFDRAYAGNRAPYVIGNHFEQWNGGIYMDAVEDAVRAMAAKPGVRFVSFRQLVDWLEAQDPDVLAELQRLDVGKAPAGGWGIRGAVV
jgi:hypothetical protein